MLQERKEQDLTARFHAQLDEERRQAQEAAQQLNDKIASMKEKKRKLKQDKN